MSKGFRKTLAFVLTFCLVFSMAVPSFASNGWGLFSKAPEPTKTYNEKLLGKDLNYVSLGDSQTDGYYLPDYFIKDENGKFVANEDGSFKSTHGFNKYVPGTYPDLFAQHLAKISGKQVNLYAYAADAMRYEDLHKLLDSSVEVDDFYREYFDSSPRYQGDYEVINKRNYFKEFYRDENYNPIGTYDLISANVRAAVKNADVISLALGTNSFGNWLSNRLAYRLTGEGNLYGERDKTKYLKLTNLQKKIFDSGYELVMDSVKKMAGDKKEIIEKLEGIVWDAVYAYTGFTTGVDACLEDIERINPDTKVVIVGLSNVADGIAIDYDGFNINLAAIAGVLAKIANSYLKSACEKTNLDATYVEPGTFDKIYKDIAAIDKNKIDFNSVMGNLMSRYIQNLFVGYGSALLYDFQPLYKAMIKESTDNETGETVTVLNAENIENGVAAVLGEANVSRNKTNNSSQPAEIEGVTYEEIGKVYLGIRDAVIESCNSTQPYSFKDVLNCFSKINEVAPDLYLGFKNSSEADLRTKVTKVLMGEPGMAGYLSLCARFIVHSAGSHINYDGHEAVAEKVIAEYDKNLLTETAKTVITHAVPVLVGGAIVTYVAKNVGKRILTAASAAALLKKIQTTFGQRKSSLFGLSSIWNN